MDLEFDGLNGAGSNGVVGAGGASQITLFRLNIHDASNGIQFSSSILDALNAGGSPGHLIWDQISIVDANIQRVIGGAGGNGMFLMAQRLSLLGNVVEDTTNAEHVVRIQYVNRGVIQANDLGLPAANKVVLTVRAVDVGTGGVTGSNITEKLMVSDSLFRGGLASAVVVFQPSADLVDQRIRDVIFDGNLITAGPQAQFGVLSSADEITMRNNVINMTGGTAHNCMAFFRKGIEPAHSQIRVYNNTCFSNDVGPPPLRVVFLDATNSNVAIANNLGYAPNSGVGVVPVLLLNQGSTGVTGGGGTLGNSSDAQILISPNFANAGGVTATDYAVNTPSYTINAGVAVPVFTDIFRISRPQGGAFDIGAAEE